MSASIGAEDGIREVLGKLDDLELVSLARTVTQGLKEISSVADAVHAILKHSPNIQSILRRKVITREILFSYLDDKDVPIKLPTTKNDLIDQIFQFWNVSNFGSTDKQNLESSIVTANNSQESNSENGVEKLAEQFSQWFFAMLNGEGVGSEHFFSDVKLTLNMICNDDVDETMVENDPERVASTLNNLKLQHDLFFNPNLSKDGVKGKMDPHGLVIVLVCGTLHIREVCAGVFEQVFALARDPFSENNWKVKSSQLNLRSKSGVLGPPKLCDSELASQIFMLPST